MFKAHTKISPIRGRDEQNFVHNIYFWNCLCVYYTLLLYVMGVVYKNRFAKPYIRPHQDPFHKIIIILCVCVRLSVAAMIYNRHYVLTVADHCLYAHCSLCMCVCVCYIHILCSVSQVWQYVASRRIEFWLLLFPYWMRT